MPLSAPSARLRVLVIPPTWCANIPMQITTALPDRIPPVVWKAYAKVDLRVTPVVTRLPVQVHLVAGMVHVRLR